MTEKRQCAKSVWHPRGNWGHHVPCQRNATVEEDGKWWCSTHAPSLAKARADKRYAEYQAARKAERDEGARAREIARLRDAVINAIREWRDGPLDAEMWTANAAKVLRAYEELTSVSQA